MSSAKFRVVIVGGGPVGLTAAHMFAKANIDFVLLERGSDICPDRGASLAMWPPTIRIFDQLGLYDALCAKSCPVISTTVLRHDGKQYDRQAYPTQTLHGHSGRICHRADLLRILFESLPSDSKSRVHLNKTVTDISVTEDSATVTCQDGSVFQGSMILAADGVHSVVRALTRSLALQEVPSDALYPEEPFTSSFQLVFGTISRPASFSPGDTYESHGKDMSTQLMNGEERSWFFLYRRLPTATSKRTIYTENDMRQCVQEMGHINMAPFLTVSDVFAEKTTASMVNLEEGVLQRRSWKRVFLAGDSSRKMTPNIGFGYHSSVWDVVVLVNQLREHVAAHPHEHIATSTLAEIFSEVDGKRDSYNKTMMGMSADVTRSSTWQTWPSYLLDRFLLPWTYSMSWMSTLIIAPLLKASPVLHWLPEPNFKSGSVPWAHIAKPESS